MIATVSRALTSSDWGGVRLEDMILVQADRRPLMLNQDRNFYEFESDKAVLSKQLHLLAAAKYYWFVLPANGAGVPETCRVWRAAI